jgi:hypothetical protein
VVEAQPELAGDDLGAEARPGMQARARGLGLDSLGHVAQPELLDEQSVEPEDRDVAGRHVHRRDTEPQAQRRERLAELRAVEALRTAEAAARQGGQHAGLADHPLRDRVPGPEAAHGGLRGRRDKERRKDGDQAKAHGSVSRNTVGGP